MANAKVEKAPETAGYLDMPGPLVVRREGLTGRTALEAFGPLVPGGRIFCLSKGAVSMADCLLYALETTGPADVFVSTWTISPGEIRTLRAALDAGQVRSLRLLVDPSFVSRHPAYTAELRATFGADVVRLAICHAKLATVVNDRWALVLRSSANLNRASRTEYYDLEDCRALAEFVTATLGEWFAGTGEGQFETPMVGHQRLFEAWHAAADGQVSKPDTCPARVVGQDTARRRALRPVTAEDARFFSDEWAGPDIRRAGLTYSR